MEFDAWLEKLHSEADDNLKDSIQAIRNNEKAKNFIKSSYMAHDDYTKKTQELAKQRVELEGTVEKLRAWHQSEAPKNSKLLAELQKREAELEAVKTKIKEEVLNEPTENPTSAPTFDTGKFVSKEEYNQMAQRLAAFDTNALQFNLDMAKVQKRSLKEGFDVEPDDLYAFARQNKVDLMQAYEAMTSETRAKKTQDEIEAKIKAARDEGFKSALTKHNLPDSPGRDTVAPAGALYRDGIQDPSKRREAALARYLDPKA